MLKTTRMQLLMKAISDSKLLNKKDIPLSEHPDLREIRVHRASEAAIRNLEIARTNARTLVVRS
ncbi:MAG: hypothetical protein ACFFFO_03450 [Candidatus Thorarchaeota archaeon]